jgi:hypothetical protein
LHMLDEVTLGGRGGEGGRRALVPLPLILLLLLRFLTSKLTSLLYIFAFSFLV